MWAPVILLCEMNIRRFQVAAKIIIALDSCIAPESDC